MEGYNEDNNSLDNQANEQYVDIFSENASNHMEAYNSNSDISDNIKENEINNENDVLTDNNNYHQENSYDYYSFSNTPHTKSLQDIKNELKAEKLRQKMQKQQNKGYSNVNGGFSLKKVLSMTALALFLGIMAGFGFVITGYIGTRSIEKSNNHISGTEVAEAKDLIHNAANGKNDVSEVTGYKVMNDVSQIVAMNKPAMVNISATTLTQLQDFFRGSYMQEVPTSGSGFIISEDENNYYIATNNHVIDNGSNLSVSFIDNSVAAAVVKGKDSYNDIAVISVKKSDISAETKQKIKKVEIGDSNNLVEGQAVVAMGNALGYGQSSTNGIISALDRSIEISDGTKMEGLIQTNAAINFGNSGGALIDATGRVIGINSAKNGSEAVEGMGYAIPISKAEPIINNILSDDREIVDSKNRGMLGITGFTTDENIKATYDIPVGFYIKEVTKGSGADKAGLVKGDVIVKINGFQVKTQRDIAERLQYFKIGETIDVTIMHQENGEYKAITKRVTISAKSQDILKQEERQKQLKDSYRQQQNQYPKQNQDYNDNGYDYNNDDSQNYYNENDNKIGELFDDMFGFNKN